MNTPTEKISLPDLYAESEHRYHTRIGILCEDREPTKEQEHIARMEAELFVREQTQLQHQS